jgi:hypothetical protein
VVLIADDEDIQDETIGGRARIERILAANDVTSALSNPRVTRFLDRFTREGRAAAYGKKDLKLEKLRVFPAEVPVALLFIRPILEGTLVASNNPDIQDQFWSTLQELITSQAGLEELRQAA